MFEVITTNTNQHHTVRIMGRVFRKRNETLIADQANLLPGSASHTLAAATAAVKRTACNHPATLPLSESFSLPLLPAAVTVLLAGKVYFIRQVRWFR
jgi:hypothetical protein